MSIPANEIAGVDPEARSANLQEGYISELEKRVAGKLAETESKLEIVSFIDRMEAEYHELDAKLNKEVNFVKTETHAAMHPYYQHLVQQQISGMSQYLHALAARLLHHGRGVPLPAEGGAPAAGELAATSGTGSDPTAAQAQSAASAENHASS